jgi:tripartite-type tricarboxylate transporter receptor subunit TctC
MELSRAGRSQTRIEWDGYHVLARALGAQRYAEDIIAKLNEAVVEALADPTVRRRLPDLANETVPREQQTPATLASWQKAEIEKWWPIIKAAGVKAE